MAQNDKGSQFDLHNTSEGKIGAKFGPWGAEAKVQNTTGFVTTDRTSTSEGSTPRWISTVAWS